MNGTRNDIPKDEDGNQASGIPVDGTEDGSCTEVRHAASGEVHNVLHDKRTESEPFCGFSPDSDDRWRKIYDVIDHAITDLNEESFADFYAGKNNLQLEIPLAQLGDTRVYEMFEYIQEKIQTSFFSDSQRGVAAGRARDSLPGKIWSKGSVACRFHVRDNALVLTVSSDKPRNPRNKTIDTGAVVTDGALSFGGTIPSDIDVFNPESVDPGTRANFIKGISAYFEILKERFLIADKEHKLLKLNIHGILSVKFRNFLRLIEEINETEGFENAFRLQRGYMFDLLSGLESKWKSVFATSKEPSREQVNMPMVGEVNVCMPTVTKMAFDRFGAGISRRVDVNGYSFLFTRVSKSTADYKECLFFVLTPDGFCYPRLAYKSRSGAKWRVSSYIKTGTSYGKGSLSYASETIPIDEVDNALNELEASTDIPTISIEINGTGDDLREEGIEKRLPLPGFYHLSDIDPNSALANKEDVDRFFGQDSVPGDFIPDFSKEPAISYVRTDGVKIEKYEHDYRGIKLRFDMASDRKGRVWVDHIQEIGGEITSFGTRRSVLLCGPFSVKPYQYDKDIHGLNPDKPIRWEKTCSFDDGSEEGLLVRETFIVKHDTTRPVDVVKADIGYDYYDITPLLDRLPLIQAYRKAKNILPVQR